MTMFLFPREYDSSLHMIGASHGRCASLAAERGLALGLISGRKRAAYHVKQPKPHATSLVTFPGSLVETSITGQSHQPHSLLGVAFLGVTTRVPCPNHNTSRQPSSNTTIHRSSSHAVTTTRTVTLIKPSTSILIIRIYNKPDATQETVDQVCILHAPFVSMSRSEKCGPYPIPLPYHGPT